MVAVSPENVTVNETMDVLIFCTYDANPVTLTSVQWFKDDVEIIIDGPQKYEGATVDQPALLLKKATREDAGAYSCRLTNAIGTGQSENVAFISVQCKPSICCSSSLLCLSLNRDLFAPSIGLVIVIPSCE